MNKRGTFKEACKYDEIAIDLLKTELLNEHILHVVPVNNDTFFYAPDIDLLIVDEHYKIQTVEVKVDTYSSYEEIYKEDCYEDYDLCNENEDSHNVLVKEKAFNYKTENNYLASAELIAKMMCDVFKLHLCAEEYVYLLALDIKCKVLGIFEVGHGMVNACLLHTREIMIRNVLCAASAFIVVHNHPSGELSVSGDDISTTKKLTTANKRPLRKEISNRYKNK